MGYPSLLYKTEPKLKPMNMSVFEDLQLLNFIPKSVAKAIRVPCEGENIIARQKLFSELMNGGRQKYVDLYLLVRDICEYNEVYKTARCENERHAVFAALMSAFVKFAETAAAVSLGDPLSERFSAHFSILIRGRQFVNMKETLNSLAAGLEGIRENSFRSHGFSLKAARGGEESYLNRISRCAEDLGLGKIHSKKSVLHRLSPDIINAVAKLNPEVFNRISVFYDSNKMIYSENVTYYRKEIEFYLTFLDFFDTITEAGIPLHFPRIIEGRGISVLNSYDVTLLAKNEKNIIPNDIRFSPDEPFYYLTGANGGGKTTYLRSVGVAAVLFLNGCPVPCDSAEFGFLSSVFTHFPRDERFDGSGRFVEENSRVEKILSDMDENSLVLLNETYSATNEENAVALTEKLADTLYKRNIFGLYITHQHSLAESKIPYLNVLIDLSDSNRRTFKIAKQKSTGGSFARDILERYSLTKEALEQRFGQLTE